MHFLRIAIGSLAELDTFLIVTKRLGYGNHQYHDQAAQLVATVGPMLHGLHESVRRRKDD